MKTISRIVNGSGRVAELTERRVRAAIEELGFRPNSAARSLRAGYDDAVGVVIENIGDPSMATLTPGVAADLLLQRVAHPSGPSRHLLLWTRKIVRGSGEMPPCDRS